MYLSKYMSNTCKSLITDKKNFCLSVSGLVDQFLEITEK